jgi:hypothetical protein
MPTQEVPARITQELPDASSTPQPSGQPSTSQAFWLQLTRNLIAGGISLGIAAKLCSWFPTCLELVRLPAGGVTHDPWSWAPLVLDLAALVAVAAPTSFRNLMDVVRTLRPPTKS